MNGWSRLAALALTSALAALTPWPARALGAPAAPEQRIDVVIVGPDASYETLAGALGPLLQSEEGVRLSRRPGSGTEAEAQTPAASTSPRSGIWIEAGEKGNVRIVVVGVDGRAAERQVRAGELTPVTAEIVAQIVHDTARALLAENADEPRPAGAQTRSPAPRPWAAAAPPSSSSTPTIEREAPVAAPPAGDTFSFELGYARRLLFDPELFFCCSSFDHSAQGIAGSVTAIRHLRTVNVFLSVMLDETWASTPALGGNVPFAALDISTFSGRVVAGLAWQPARLVEVRAGLGAGGDYIQAKAGSTATGSVWLPGVRGTLRLSVLVPRTALEVWAAFTVDARQRAMLTQSAPPSEVSSVSVPFFNTAPFQPGMGLGLGWRL